MRQKSFVDLLVVPKMISEALSGRYKVQIRKSLSGKFILFTIMILFINDMLSMTSSRMA